MKFLASLRTSPLFINLGPFFSSSEEASLNLEAQAPLDLATYPP